jgi:hypothetical protein
MVTCFPLLRVPISYITAICYDVRCSEGLVGAGVHGNQYNHCTSNDLFALRWYTHYG